MLKRHSAYSMRIFGKIFYYLCACVSVHMHAQRLEAGIRYPGVIGSGEPPAWDLELNEGPQQVQQELSTKELSFPPPSQYFSVGNPCTFRSSN